MPDFASVFLDWAHHYSFSRWVFLRGIGLVFAIAFLSLFRQIRGLIGQDGIAPAKDYLEAVKDQYGKRAYRLLPTIFWWRSDDRTLLWASGIGIFFSLCLLFSILEIPSLLILLVLYLSNVQVGQDFLAFQWDVLLIETAFCALFTGTPVGFLLLWWLLFRLMFESGAVKLSCGDETWRKLTSLNVHYLTQPLPHAGAWYAHRLPSGFQKFSVLMVLAIELLLPFLIVSSLREWAAAGFIFLMILIMATGNYNFFCLLTALLSLTLIDNETWRQIIPQIPADLPTWELSWLWIPHGIICVLAMILGLPQVYQSAFPDWGQPKFVSRLQKIIRPYRLLNSYGLFRNMTLTRPELIIEASMDGKEWQPYEFKHKPGDLKRMPAFIQPHHPRLDWQMWFAALRPYPYTSWMQSFLYRLMERKPAVLSLLKKPPFAERPRFLRVRLFDYQYTTAAEKKVSGNYWRREFIRDYAPTFVRERSVRADGPDAHGRPGS